jgi:peptidoglycan/LPS O-acetylase OafA/YrhL
MRISQFLNKDNNNLDLIRIILACLVIVGHSQVLNGSDNYWIDPIPYFFNFTYSGAIAVKIFFFISGLVITNSYLGNKSASYFIISRFFRLMPALFFVLLISAFFLGPMVTNFELTNYFSELNYFSYILHNIVFYTDYILPGVFETNVYPHIVNGSLWSLRFEVGCYIVLFFLFRLLGNRNKLYMNIPILIIIIDTFLPTRILFNFLGNNPEKYLLPMFFAYGAFFAINSEKIRINLIVVFFSIVVFYVFRNTNYNEIFLIVAFCNGIIYLSSLKFILKLKPKHDISYGIYLWGFPVQQAVYYYLGHINIGLHCFVALFFSILFGLITFLLIEKRFIKIGKSMIFYMNDFKLVNKIKNVLKEV